MRLPKRGERGFTLIELLIVVAILGVLAAVVIPNVGQFIGAGKEEAKDTELANIQAAVHSMMINNGISTLPVPVSAPPYENDMAAFPDATATLAQKDFTEIQAPDDDKIGYLLFSHDMLDDGLDTVLVNYVATQNTTYYYSVDAAGTVSQWDNDDCTNNP